MIQVWTNWAKILSLNTILFLCVAWVAGWLSWVWMILAILSSKIPTFSTWLISQSVDNDLDADVLLLYSVFIRRCRRSNCDLKDEWQRSWWPVWCPEGWTSDGLSREVAAKQPSSKNRIFYIKSSSTRFWAHKRRSCLNCCLRKVVAT